MDWGQLWEIASAPDNVPIVALILLVPFYTWYGLRQSFANDRLIAQLEADPQMAKTHHRKGPVLETRLGQRNPCLAILVKNRISLRGYRHVDSHGLVHYAQCPAGRACQPDAHDESFQGTLVFPGTAGDVSLLRSLDGRGGSAQPYFSGFDGHSLY